MSENFPLFYLDDTGKEVRLRRDKYRNYHTEDGRMLKRGLVYSKYKFLRRDNCSTQWEVGPNGFKVRKKVETKG